MSNVGSVLVTPTGMVRVVVVLPTMEQGGHARMRGMGVALGSALPSVAPGPKPEAETPAVIPQFFNVPGSGAAGDWTGASAQNPEQKQQDRAMMTAAERQAEAGSTPGATPPEGDRTLADLFGQSDILPGQSGATLESDASARLIRDARRESVNELFGRFQPDPALAQPVLNIIG